MVDVDNNHYFTIHWDEKLLKAGKAFSHNKRLAVLASATNRKLVKLMGLTDLDSENELNQATAIKNMLEEWNVKERWVATCFDTTTFNTGKFAGACIFCMLSLEILFVVDVMSSPYARNDIGGCLQSNIWPH